MKLWMLGGTAAIGLAITVTACGSSGSPKAASSGLADATPGAFDDRDARRDGRSQTEARLDPG